MSVAILADRLGKRYRLGGRESYGALRDSLSRFARNPLSAFRPAGEDRTRGSMRSRACRSRFVTARFLA